ncbi:MAG: ABC transporter ATP-binding protein, partial [Verrucomicrobiota bacterium]|nr:ABC transporter ATP-binding protein [Verrucomicrobiota bacterium]
VLQGSTDFGMPQLLTFFLLANMLYQPISQLHGLNHLIAAGRASGKRVFEILDANIEVAEPAEPILLPDGPIKIVFDNVNFQYPGRPAVLNQFNLTLESNKVTALVGHTGAGKSTVANLSMRTYDINGGSIKLSNVDINRISLAQLHDKVGHVAQDPFLFEGTIRDNLALAKNDANDSEMIYALEQACAW